MRLADLIPRIERRVTIREKYSLLCQSQEWRPANNQRQDTAADQCPPEPWLQLIASLDLHPAVDQGQAVDERMHIAAGVKINPAADGALVEPKPILADGRARTGGSDHFYQVVVHSTSE